MIVDIDVNAGQYALWLAAAKDQSITWSAWAIDACNYRVKTGRSHSAGSVSFDRHESLYNVLPAQLLEWTDAAHDEGRTLSEWVTEACNWRLIRGSR